MRGFCDWKSGISGKDGSETSKAVTPYMSATGFVSASHNLCKIAMHAYATSQNQQAAQEDQCPAKNCFAPAAGKRIGRLVFGGDKADDWHR